MAMFDNYQFLVNHIRNSFITSDETGMCELILESDVTSAQSALGLHIPASPTPATSDAATVAHDQSVCVLESDVEPAHSLDIVFNMDLTGHRRRSNTSQRLEKLKLDKQKQSKIKHISWKNTSHTVDEYEEHFEKKLVSIGDTDASGPDPGCGADQQPMSVLSRQLQQFDNTSQNPFMDFAKFDGRAGSGSIPSKKIDIYLTMAMDSDRAYPMTVVCLSNAKIQQLIGLICWQYTMENRQPALQQSNVDAYTLNMVEDDGDVDSDFPALDCREPVNKFGFNKLALVEKVLAPHSTLHFKTQTVTVRTADGKFYTVSVNSDDTFMRDILNEVLEQRNIDLKMGQRYRLEKVSVPGLSVDLDSPFSTVNSTDFCLIRENSVWPSSVINSASAGTPVTDDDLMCHQYRSYDVNIVHKLRPSTNAQLGVSSDKIELTPTAANMTGTSRFSRHSLIFSKPKPVMLSMDDVATCLLLYCSATAQGLHVVRLIYSIDEFHFKHYDLECPETTAGQIVSQIVNILNCRTRSAAHENFAKSEKALKLSRRYTLRT